MAGAGFGRGVRLIAGGEDDAQLQPPQAAGEILAILGEQVGGELIDRNGDDQPRPGRRLRLGRKQAIGSAARAASSLNFMTTSRQSWASSWRPRPTNR